MTSEAMEKYETLLSEATEVLPDPNAKELLLSTLIGNLEGMYTPTATLNKLRAIGITTFGDLVNHSEAELKESGLSNYMITGLRRMLERRGFTFKT